MLRHIFIGWGADILWGNIHIPFPITALRVPFYTGYWCSGKIRCGTCGSRFVPKITHRRNGDTYKIWECHSRAHYGNWKQNGQGEYVGCNMRILNDKALIACVQFVLQQLDLDYDALAQELAAIFRKS